MSPRVDAFNTTAVLQGTQPMPPGSFLNRLPPAEWSVFVQAWGPDARTYTQGEQLPLGPHDGHVYIMLGGCVVQERFPLGAVRNAPRVARFRGVGELLGEAKLLHPASAVTTVCLSTTWVMPCPVQRVTALLRRRHLAQTALLQSLEARCRSDELIYCTAYRPPVHRVGALLLHLAVTAGTTDPGEPGPVTIMGPRQKDIADALLMGTSTVEKAVRELRSRGVIHSRYRQLVVTDAPRLQRILASGGNPPAPAPQA
ncbi:helix-turn-helix domain-containing protein [Streptomyces sp. SID4919]|uniref:Crp/Fnr family transcriptional regulator n=1 Tax=unclassified Streptomyces TaxID=2593676 RepID=UPI000823B343|nr:MULTISPECIES: Crp/Fnr family transcriptional regulator [unclassified Streptomyces]MYY13484.1 helix-turn-helix domain-containing protein [Streptomyces sp. SID4919]SCK63113.1 cAMP-binding domain of CRP or a regulatory subunit of cAMP-dependent protein kinases [Streptomyces sp. AmelKG-E11A]